MNNTNDTRFFKNVPLDEAISLVEALVAKAHITSDKANTKILIIPSDHPAGNVRWNINNKLTINPSNTKLIIVVQDTIMFEVPMKNEFVSVDFYGAGSGIHMNGFEYYDRTITENLLYKYAEYQNIIGTKLPIAYDNELRSNEDFEKLLGLKSSQGLHFYHLPDLDHPGEVYLIPMFAGFLSLNKADTIGVKVYDYDEINHLIVFDIFKKKINRNVQMFCRVLKI